MFTDKPTTPNRIEVLLELVHAMRQRKLDRTAVRKLLQPKGLSGLTDKSDQANETLKAARELDLIEEDSTGSFRPAWTGRKSFVAKDLLIKALDEKVLSSTEIEPWFARFFSYVITKEEDWLVPGKDAGQRWSTAFNRDLYGGQPPKNPLNPDKYSDLLNWMGYAGLGWYDSQENFIPSPYDRVRRKLDDIFGKKSKLTSDDFMHNLAFHCPELDGGTMTVVDGA
jgi:hypothetical protein